MTIVKASFQLVMDEESPYIFDEADLDWSPDGCLNTLNMGVGFIGTVVINDGRQAVTLGDEELDRLVENLCAAIPLLAAGKTASYPYLVKPSYQAGQVSGEGMRFSLNGDKILISSGADYYNEQSIKGQQFIKKDLFKAIIGCTERLIKLFELAQSAENKGSGSSYFNSKIERLKDAKIKAIAAI